jgi:hypothetical protein
MNDKLGENDNEININYSYSVKSEESADLNHTIGNPYDPMNDF